MALEVRIPAIIQVNGSTIKNKQVSVWSSQVSVMLYAQVFDTFSSGIIEQRAFSAFGAKTHPKIYDEAVRDLAKGISIWADGIRSAVSLKLGALSNLESDVLAALTT